MGHNNMQWKREPGTTRKIELAEQMHRRPHVLTILLSLLVALALLHFIAVTHSAYPTVIADTCDKAIRNANYTQYISLTKAQEMSAVQFTDTLTAGQPSAMVQVVDKSEQNILDVYIYGCSMKQHGPTLSLLFKQQGLVQGTASLTLAHTLSIGQLDTTLASSGSSFLLPFQENVYREYVWQGGSLKQTFFPGLYPIASRSEAEALQTEANADQNLPWQEPGATVEQMAQDLFKWSPKSFHTTLLDQNGTQAHVRLVQPQLHMQIAVSLARLVQHDKRGLWFVTGAQTSGITFKQSSPYATTSSPIAIQGHLAGTTKSTLSAILFDHTLSPVPPLNTVAIHPEANGKFEGTLLYTNLLPGQPGLLLLQTLPPSVGSTHPGVKRKKVGHPAPPETGQLLLVHIFLG